MTVAATRPARTRADRTLLALLTAMALWLLVMQAVVERSPFPPIGILQAAWLAIPAALSLWLGLRWWQPPFAARLARRPRPPAG